MANWCVNRVNVKHKDTKMIERLITAYNNETLLEEFVPFPIGTSEKDSEEDRIVYKLTHGEFDWYNWRLDNWGTKWDIEKYGEGVVEYKPGQTSVRLVFCTAWAPPELAWEKWSDLGFVVKAKYLEEGMGMKGTYVSGGAK